MVPKTKSGLPCRRSSLHTVTRHVRRQGTRTHIGAQTENAVRSFARDNRLESCFRGGRGKAGGERKSPLLLAEERAGRGGPRIHPRPPLEIPALWPGRRQKGLRRTDAKQYTSEPQAKAIFPYAIFRIPLGSAHAIRLVLVAAEGLGPLCGPRSSLSVFIFRARRQPRVDRLRAQEGWITRPSSRTSAN